ncbi:hypothetical protein ACV1DN_09475 [Aeromonas allosaccharophila]
MTADYEWQMTCPMCGTSHPEDSEQAQWLSMTKATPAQVLEHALREVIRIHVANDELPGEMITEQVGRIAAMYIAKAEAALGVAEVKP